MHSISVTAPRARPFAPIVERAGGPSVKYSRYTEFIADSRDVREEDRALHDVVQRGAGGGQTRLDVLEPAVCAYPASILRAAHFAGLGADLTRQEEQVPRCGRRREHRQRRHVAARADHFAVRTLSGGARRRARLFHTFDADERATYVANRSVVGRSGTLYVLCFSNEDPDTGPHTIRPDELRAAFTAAGGWSIAELSAERIETRFHDNGAPAWLATIQRI